jgi:nucleotide-binding universal stress UspA family protein
MNPGTDHVTDRSQPARRVVAGFDGRWQNGDLLRTAASEAGRRNLGLTVVTVLRPPPTVDRDPRAAESGEARASVLAGRRLNRALDGLREQFPDLDLQGSCLPEAAVRAGRPPLDRAAVLVIGTRGQFDDRALHLESVSRGLFKAARCPVLAVPEKRRRPAGPPYVLAAVSDSPRDEAVLSEARSEAERRGCELRLLHVGDAPGPSAGVEVAPQVLEAAAAAEVLVIGGRAGALSGLVRDSVSRQVLEDPPCPVLAVPRDIVLPGRGSRPAPVS